VLEFAPSFATWVAEKAKNRNMKVLPRSVGLIDYERIPNELSKPCDEVVFEGATILRR
jgi:hypothetical protein